MPLSKYSGRFALAGAALLLGCAGLSAATHTVNSASGLTTLLNSGIVLPGDTINWTNGTYSSTQSINFQGASGTSSAPITLRAQTPGGVIFTGQASLRIGGNYLVVVGFHFKGTETSTIIQFRSSSNVEARHCRVTNCAITDLVPSGANTSKWVQFYGTDHQLDHCTLRGKTSKGALIIAELGGLGVAENANHLIEYNYIGDVLFPPGADPDTINEYEGLRIGTSDDQFKPANCLARFNLFENVDADPEVISNKSTGNRYLYNTLRECAGQFVLRHGDGCTVAGNFILGNAKAGTGGIRVVGTGHKIYNNYLSGLRQSPLKSWTTGLSLMAGSTSAAADGYVLPDGVSLMFNTLYDCDDSIVVGEGLGGNGRSASPRNCTFANNLIVSARGQLIEHKGTPVNIIYANNIGHGSPIGISANSSTVNPADPVMALSDGLYRPSTEGPAANSAGAAFPEVTDDVDGQGRPAGGRDIGADEVSGASGGITRRPLVSSDVGAGFLGGSGGGDTTPEITTTALPAGVVGEAYSQGLSVAGGNSPFTWSLAGGSLPDGLSLNSTGTISGTPAASGTANFTVQVVDSDGDADTQSLSLTVNALAQVAAPAFSPAAGSYTSAQSVTISSSTSGASIRYTTDGTAPTLSSGTLYTVPVNIGSTTTLKAIAYKGGMADSAVTSGNYTITISTQVATPGFSPAGGTYTTAQSVTISTATSGAAIRYTTDGSTPTSGTGTVYSGPVTVSTTATLKAIAYKSGMTASAVASAPFVISAGGSNTLLNETFGDGERATQNLPNSAAWYGNNSSALSVSSNALVVSPSCNALAYFTAAGAPVALGVGDSLQLTFSMTPNGTAFTSSGDFFRVALLNSCGTSSDHNATGTANRVSTNSYSTATTAFNNYGGYMFTLPLNPATAAAVKAFEHDFNATNGLTGTSSYSQIGSTGGTGPYGFVPGNSYTGTFLIQRTASGTVSVTLSFSGTFASGTGTAWSYAQTDSSAATYTFDALAFYISSGSGFTSLRLDDLAVTSTAAASAPVLSRAFFRDDHGGNTVDIDVYGNGATSNVEGRRSNSGGYSLLVQFNQNVTAGEVAVEQGGAAVSAVQFSGNTATITLAGVADRQKLVLKLHNFANGGGPVMADQSLTVRFLTGDADRDGVVNAVDLSLLRDAYGKSHGQAGFSAACDFETDGTVNAMDLTWQRYNYGFSVAP